MRVRKCTSVLFLGRQIPRDGWCGVLITSLIHIPVLWGVGGGWGHIARGFYCDKALEKIRPCTLILYRFRNKFVNEIYSLKAAKLAKFMLVLTNCRFRC